MSIDTTIPARIQETADAILEEVIAQRENLATLTTQELTDLLHQARELNHHSQSCVRVAASIVGAAAQLALEKRYMKKNENPTAQS